ncbi:hypothetical protein ABT369_25680 [Dactylosporangium sp. NPDC000244]|uniref:hypothetical protein n=1 Tax=Dactylosporangium sp. NPDC000244 TaxID=3154365 RepID=UPI00331A8C19
MLLRIRWTRALVAALAAVVLGSVVPGPPAVAHAPSAGVGKYYVVGPPVNGRNEFLFDIAARTLGNGRRYTEILQLNAGRPQPDGGQLSDPATLRPGWVLLLPPDAAGPGVHDGPPPGFPPTDGPAPQAATGGGGQHRPLMAVVLIVVLVAALWLLLRTRGRAWRHEPVPAGPATTDADAWDRPEVPGRLLDYPAEAEPPPPPPVPGRRPAPDRPGPGDQPDGDVIEAEVMSLTGQDRAVVRLAGRRGHHDEPAWLWLDPDAERPPRPTVVALGWTDDAALCADLAQAPDVLTLTGPTPSARRLAAGLARQLAEAGVAVVVVGPAAGPTLPDVHAVASLADAAGFPSATEPVVVICDTAEPDHTARIRELTIRQAPRTVVVLVGAERGSRWSVQVQPAPGDGR